MLKATQRIPWIQSSVFRQCQLSEIHLIMAQKAKVDILLPSVHLPIYSLAGFLCMPWFKQTWCRVTNSQLKTAFLKWSSQKERSCPSARSLDYETSSLPTEPSWWPEVSESIANLVQGLSLKNLTEKAPWQDEVTNFSFSGKYLSIP